MGIRFFCPKGHRVHVKAALAGKKGFCPDCGERVRIPHESDPQALKKPAAPVAANGTASHASPGPATPSLAIPSPAHGDVAVTLTGSDPSSSKVNLSESSTDASKSGINGAAGVASLLPASKGRSAKPAIDAIDESIESAWYVRPVGGGQYGPAKGATMRKWLGEGRVGADSLVWREGWTDWKTASDVFPGLPGEKPPEPTFEIKKPVPAPSETAPAMNMAVTSTSPRPVKIKSNTTAILIVAGLTIVCAGLFAALVYVLVK
jgi:hypothetical protein